MALVFGCAAFALLMLFDLNKIFWKRGALSVAFPLGFLLLGVSLILCLREYAEAHSLLRWSAPFLLSLLGMLGALALLVYALFFALPAEDVYGSAQGQMVVATGLYGLCRHPAAWAFALFLLFFYLSFPSGLTFTAGLLFSLLNFLYVFLQDRFWFPVYIAGYQDYQKQVPFLIPSRKAVRRLLSRRG